MGKFGREFMRETGYIVIYKSDKFALYLACDFKNKKLQLYPVGSGALSFSEYQALFREHKLLVEMSDPPKISIGEPHGYSMNFEDDEIFTVIFILMKEGYLGHSNVKNEDIKKLDNLLAEFHRQLETNPNSEISSKYKAYKTEIERAKNEKEQEITNRYNAITNVLTKHFDAYKRRSGRNEHRRQLCEKMQNMMEISIPQTKEIDHVAVLIGMIECGIDEADREHKKHGTLRFLGTKSSLAKELRMVLNEIGEEFDRDTCIKAYNDFNSSIKGHIKLQF